jgi:hypothetical protein
MKDFLKIFFALIALVGAFLIGRSHGEANFKESEEYQTLIKQQNEEAFANNELENAKTKFQNILDGSETKKSEELLAQILQIFLADLGLRIENQKNFTKEHGIPSKLVTPERKTPQPVLEQVKQEVQKKKEKVFDFKRLKSYEWILLNSTNPNRLSDNLKNVEIKDIDSYMKKSIPATPQQLELFYGSYRGRILDIFNKEYATLVLEINSIETDGPQKLKGKIQIFKNGREESSRNFSTTQLGYLNTESSAIVIENGSLFYQLYKKDEKQ